jgi:lysophospholipase L1-like esterase
MHALVKRFAGNVLAAGIGLLLSFAALEGGVRVLAKGLGISSYMEYDEMLGWTATPDTIRHHKDAVEGFQARYVINSRGLRGELYPVRKVAGVYRVVVLGDSNGFGWGVQEGETFSALLDGFAADVQVVNLSLSGYATDQQYLRFLREGVAFQPDLVVLQLTANDFEEIQHPFANHKPKPQYVLTPTGELRLLNVPARPIGPKADDYSARSLPLPFKHWLGWHSYAYTFLNERYYRFRRGRMAGREAGHDQDPIAVESVRLFARIAAELKTKAAEVGARTIVFHGSKELNASANFRGSGVTVIDLYPTLAGLARSASVPTFFKDGYHWTAEGHRVVARELWAALKAHR